MPMITDQGLRFLNNVLFYARNSIKRVSMVAFKGVWTQSFWKAVSGEFVATLIFVFLCLGSTINWGTADSAQQIDLVQISLCFGFGITTMVHCFGHISGAHINPAVTIALLCTRKITLAKALFYITAQCLGAVLGAGLLYLITPPSLTGNLGVTMVNTYNNGKYVLFDLETDFIYSMSTKCRSLFPLKILRFIFYRTFGLIQTIFLCLYCVSYENRILLFTFLDDKWSHKNLLYIWRLVCGNFISCSALIKGIIL